MGGWSPFRRHPAAAYTLRMARFLKMHGCGNDFVVFDERAGALDLTARRAAAIADRRTGVGCDQFIAIEPAPEDSNADAFMRIRNPDGAEAGACGNATRCVVDLLARETGRRVQVIRTVAGDLPSEALPDGRVCVDMGPARLDWPEVPLARPMDTLHLDLEAGPVADPAAVNMGNPHATFFVDDVARVPVSELGLRLEHDPLFPERANIGFAQVLAPDRIRLRVWERSAGLTLACGSGACAALVNAHRRGLTGRRAAVLVDGGELEIEWRADGHVLMTGPVATSFIGEIDLAAYPP
jgi:diaminopimelate epimerase